MDCMQAGTWVVFGTGRVAKRFYEYFGDKYGKEPSCLYWCDNDSRKWGKIFLGRGVIPPIELFRKVEKEYANGNKLNIVIAAQGIGCLEILTQLLKQGIEGKAAIFSAVQIYANYFFDQYNKEYTDIVSIFADNKSKIIYQNVIRDMRKGIYADFSLAEIPAYINNDVIPFIEENEIIIDAGVCEGEEIDSILKSQRNVQIHAFEPNEKSMKNLKNKYSENVNVKLYNCALWNESKKVIFDNNDDAVSAARVVDGDSGIRVNAIMLDDLDIKDITYIKMDIEGAEYEALLGAKQVIKQYHPKLAISIYHNIDDYIRIPLLIRELYPEYKFYFRHHSVTMSESIFYAIP